MILQPTIYRVVGDIPPEPAQPTIYEGITDDINGLRFQGGIYVGRGNSPIGGGFFTDADLPFRRILLKQGTAATMPVLAPGELGYATDTGVLYVGTIGGANLAIGATAPAGVPVARDTADLTGQTAAIATVVDYTVGASDGSFVLSATIVVTSAITAGAVTVVANWTDETSTVRSNNMVSSPATISATGAYLLSGVEVRAKSGTLVSMSTLFSGISGTYDISATLLQLR